MLANLDRQLEFQARRRKDAHEKFQKKWDKTLQKQDILVHALAKFSVLFNVSDTIKSWDLLEDFILNPHVANATIQIDEHDFILGL